MQIDPGTRSGCIMRDSYGVRAERQDPYGRRTTQPEMPWTFSDIVSHCWACFIDAIECGRARRGRRAELR